MSPLTAALLAAGMLIVGACAPASPPAAAPTQDPSPDPVVGGTLAQPPSQPHVAAGTESAEVRLFAVGDIATCDDDVDEEVAAFLRKRSAPVALLGDTVYEYGTPQEFAECFDPAWGPMLDRLHPAVGNHEYGTSGAEGYFEYFGERAGRPGKGWYAYNLGEHWRVIALNSQCSVVGCDTGSRQLEWLEAALDRAGSRNVLAYFHVPRFSSGAHGSSLTVKAIFSALNRGGADLVLSGHDHSYERFAPQNAGGKRRPGGVVQFVVGTGGRYLYPFEGEAARNSQARNDDTHGVLRLDLRPRGYSWKFIPVVGDFTDSGSRPVD